VKQECPAVAWPPLRWVAAALAAAALTLGASACSGGDAATPEPSDPLTAALSYLPSSTGLVAVVPTDGSSVRAVERLGKSAREGRLLRARLYEALSAAGVDPVALRAQLGNPLALGFAGATQPLAALRLRDPATFRRLIEERIASRSAERLDARDDVLAWRERGGSARSGVAAIDRRQLVLAASQPDLDRALEAATGKQSIAYEQRFVAELDRIGDGELLRSVGDAQRLLSRDAVRADALRRIPWVRALGLITGTARVQGGKVRLQFDLRTDRAPLTVGELPLAPGTRSPPVHDSGAAAAFASLDPDRLARFIERTVEVTNPDAYANYATGIDQLSSLFAVDVHYDIFRKLKSISVAFASPAALRFVAPLETGAETQVLTSLRRAAPAIQFALPNFLPGAKLVPRGDPPNEWSLRRGKIVAGRYAVENGALVGSIGLDGLPKVNGHRVRGVSGSLVAVGDLRQLGRIAGLVFNLPAQALAPVLELGDVVLGVRSDTEALTGNGYLKMQPRD
jgi:hypothetical protein